MKKNVTLSNQVEPIFDVAIIGGGIHGCGAAADAALRGLSVFLCDKGDLASGTSSKSSKLIHGGLRYLEHFDIPLVKKALFEQACLLNRAPYLVHPLSFVMPHNKEQRPLWLLRAGLFIYDHLKQKNTLPKTISIKRLSSPNYFAPLKTEYNNGFLFSDCSTDDARLTVINALLAREHGANIATHTECLTAFANKNEWTLTLSSAQKGTYTIRAKSIINAAGPWSNQLLQRFSITPTQGLSFVKGSHIIVPQLYTDPHAYVLQHSDKRIVFVIPFHKATLIGTTEIELQNEPNNEVTIDNAEINYLLHIANHHFQQRVTQADVLATWSGVRALISKKEKNTSAKSISTLSRDAQIEFTVDPAPLVTLYGGKITTYRKLAEEAIDQLSVVFPAIEKSKTRHTPLPGTTHKKYTFHDYQQETRKRYGWLEKEVLDHYLQTYGTRTEHILKLCTTMQDLGIRFTPSLYQAEVDYLVQEEWARDADDILWRRTKHGLYTDITARDTLSDYMNQACRC